jgi:Domain of unknown function (DUF4476)
VVNKQINAYSFFNKQTHFTNILNSHCMRNLFFLISIVILMSSTVAAQTPAKVEGRRLNNTPAAAATATAPTAAKDSTAPKIQSRTKKAGQSGQPEVVKRQMKDKNGNAATQEFRRRQPDAYRCNMPLYERDFQFMYNRLADTRRDQDYAITQFVHRSCLTVDQIGRLAGLYNDDADRLLFVFDAFSYCYDFNSYDLLITLFRQGTHITKFNDFIYDNLYEPTNGGYYGYNNGGYCWYGTEQGVGGGWNNYSNNGYNNGGNNGYNPPRNDPYFNPNAGSFDENGGGRGGNGGGGRGDNGGGGRGNNGGNGGGRGDDGRGGGRGNNGGNGGGNGGHNHNDHDDHNHGGGNYNPPVNYGPQAMNPNDFNAALSSIQRNSFENTRLQMAQQIGGINWLSTDQIAAICRLFSFDNTRLDFAKFAYSRCVDPQNYYRVNEVMQFSSNGSALSDFVMSNPPQQPNYNNNQNNNNNNNNYNDNNYNNNQNNNNYAPVPVNANEFQDIRNNIRSKGVESTKLQVAKQICETRYFTAEQISDLARLFGVESYKLDFAKFAYARCSDPQNYYKVNSVFGVQSYVRELTDFIRR